MVLMDRDSAQDRDPFQSAAANFTVHTPHAKVISVPGKGPTRARRQDLVRRYSRQNFVQFGAEQVPPAAFRVNNAFSDVRITGAGVHVVRGGILQVVVSATAPTAGKLELIAGPFLFDRIEIQPDGATTADTIYPEQIYLHEFMVAGDEEGAQLGTVQGVAAGQISINSVTGAQARQPTSFDQLLDQGGPGADDITHAMPLVDGASREYWYDLNCCIFRSDVFLPKVKNYMRVRQYWRQTPFVSGQVALSPGEGLTLATNQLILYGDVFSSSVLSAMTAAYRGQGFMSRCLTHERQTFTIDASPGVQVADFSLTSFNGQFANLIIAMRAQNATDESLYQFEELQSITLEDASGNPVNFNQMQNVLLKNVIYNRNYNSRFTLAANPTPPPNVSSLSKAVYEIPFSSNSEMTIRGRANYGGYYFNGNDTLRITPLSATGTRTVYIIAERYASLTVTDDGCVTVEKH